MNRESLLEYLKSCKSYFYQKYGIKHLYLFGSFARDEAKKQSDIDLLADFDEKNLTLSNFLDFKRELEAKLKIKVDLATKDMIKPKLWKYIQKDLINV